MTARIKNKIELHSWVTPWEASVIKTLVLRLLGSFDRMLIGGQVPMSKGHAEYADLIIVKGAYHIYLELSQGSGYCVKKEKLCTHPRRLGGIRAAHKHGALQILAFADDSMTTQSSLVKTVESTPLSAANRTLTMIVPESPVAAGLQLAERLKKLLNNL